MEIGGSKKVAKPILKSRNANDVCIYAWFTFPGMGCLF